MAELMDDDEQIKKDNDLENDENNSGDVQEHNESGKQKSRNGR